MNDALAFMPKISNNGSVTLTTSSTPCCTDKTRREILTHGLSVAAAAAMPTFAADVALAEPQRSTSTENIYMDRVTTRDGVKIFYKDWGEGQPIVFHHGWPLSADDWDTQMLFFVQHGYRVIAYDRRGHGRSSQVSDGHDMDHYAADVAVLVDHLNLRDAVHIGHSAGGGVVARYVARHGKGRVVKAVLMSAVAPLVLKTEANPEGLPLEVLDGLRNGIANNRAQFYRDVPSGPFYGFNRPNAKPLEGVIENWWRQGMMGGSKAQYDGVKPITETDLSDDLKRIDVATLVMHGDDDQIVPYKAAALRSMTFLKHGTLKIYPGFPHGMLTTHADVINKDLLDFIRG
ncbi:alpha/beta fold hydrolase [Bradyrhizobium sp.]|uniref:alpha/beta fold hydrolase n=1 Tax=Bradyrhizobium sp. TaxID=376 RepID=UPI003C5B91F4